MNPEEMKKLVEEQQALFKQLADTKEEQFKKYDVLLTEQTSKLADAITAIEAEKQEKQRIEKAVSNLEIAFQKSFDNAPSAEKEKELEQKKHFLEFVKSKDPNKTELNIIDKSFAIQKDLRTDSNPDGGYAVRDYFSNFISTFLRETSPIRQLASVETIGADTYKFYQDDDQAGAIWVEQGGLGSDTTTPTLGMGSISVHKMATTPKATTESLEDPELDLEQWLMQKVADKFARTENTAFVQGSGVGSPRGFMTYPAWAVAGTYERGKIEQVNSGAAADFAIAGLINIQNSLKEAYQPSAVWGMKRASFGNILKLNSANNYHFLGFQPSDRQGFPQMVILGKPVVFMDDLAAVGAGNLAAVYGDFRAGYKIIDRKGLSILRNPYITKGFVEFWVEKRTGGDVVNFDALKIQVIAS